MTLICSGCLKDFQLRIPNKKVCIFFLFFHVLIISGKRKEVSDNENYDIGLELDEESHVLAKLKDIIESPPDDQDEYTRIKKDIFHAFHMIPIPVNHGARPAFLRALRDHLMRWDPVSKSQVDKVCREHFDLTFNQMLRRNPRFIAERTPRYIPPPSVLVIAIQHVYDMFKDSIDAKTRIPLFTEPVKIKAKAVLELARQGYLSDIEGVPMYEKAGIDAYGLQKWKCIRGTNNVEGGPHGDIYRKFGALHGKIFFVLTSTISYLYFFFSRSTIDNKLSNRPSYMVQSTGIHVLVIEPNILVRANAILGICKTPFRC